MAIDVNELLAPIPGSDPAGSDASFSDQFDRIREARRADDAGLAQGEWQTELKVADWREAQSLAEDILLRTSKDLQAAVWLGEAAISRFGLEGARDGFDLLTGLLDQYWDGLYPRAEDGDLEERASKLAWFSTYGSRALQTLMLNDDPQAALTGPELGLWRKVEAAQFHIGLVGADIAAAPLDQDDFDSVLAGTLNVVDAVTDQNHSRQVGVEQLECVLVELADPRHEVGLRRVAQQGAGALRVDAVQRQAQCQQTAHGGAYTIACGRDVYHGICHRQNLVGL